ncbi:hypothetical protein AJ79_03354 [Helicocarpus griseus UAMH5409]|uniref:Swi5-domain-containing protein n=1 Tax=Helicocarpus griseus UAMH5409 TaxID=1447875 RepID=A0A2B7XYD9_9EURO|nr:hypothetical protein AJ79_03354 [Helicocarpus griseus UAMH5409]
MTSDQGTSGVQTTDPPTPNHQTPAASTSASTPQSKPESDQTTPTQYSEKHEKMINTLKAKIDALQSEISKTDALLAEAREKLNPPDQTKLSNTETDTAFKDPTAIVQRHIRLLHEYNEIKDIGQGLMGLIAEARGVRHVDVQRDFGIGEKD